MAVTTCTRALGFLEKTYGDLEGVFLLQEANKLLRKLAHQELPPVAELDWVGDQKWDSSKPKVNWSFQRAYKVGESTVGVRSFFNRMKATTLAGYELIFTDGSKANGKVGLGISGNGFAFHQQLRNMCSVFPAEAAAIHVAVMNAKESYTAILSDSASVLKALETDRITHPWVQAIRAKANPYTLFVWIPGHCGIPGNESADQLAALGRNSQFLTTQVPSQDAKTWVKNVLWNAWGVTWQREQNLFIRKIKGEINKWKDQINRKDQRILSRLRTGHTRISHFQSGRYNQSTCETCGIRRSVEHILAVCPQYQSLRTSFGLDTGIRNILANDSTTEKSLLFFLKEANIYDEI